MRIKFLLFLLCACPAFTANLSIQVENILPKQGKIYVGVFDRENYIHNGKATRDTFVNANHVNMVVAFDNIPAGIYSVRIYQDVNNNGILDTGLFGLPIEKCGFSNNIIPFMGGNPSFEKTRFLVFTSDTIHIKLR